jgi:hypothetical protein
MVEAKRSVSSASYVSAEERSKESNSPLVGNQDHTRFQFDDNLVVIVTQGIESQVNGIVSTSISSFTAIGRIVTGTIVRGRTLGVRVDVRSVGTEVDSVVEASGTGHEHQRHGQR